MQFDQGMYVLEQCFADMAVAQWRNYGRLLSHRRNPKEETITDGLIKELDFLKNHHFAGLRWLLYAPNYFEPALADRLRVMDFTKHAEAQNGVDLEIWLRFIDGGHVAGAVGFSLQAKRLSWDAGKPIYGSIAKKDKLVYQHTKLVKHANTVGANAFILLYNGDDLTRGAEERLYLTHSSLAHLTEAFGCAAVAADRVESLIDSGAGDAAEKYLLASVPWSHLLRLGRQAHQVSWSPGTGSTLNGVSTQSGTQHSHSATLIRLAPDVPPYAAEDGTIGKKAYLDSLPRAVAVFDVISDDTPGERPAVRG